MAQDINIWSDVQINVQTALATAKVITAITKASPPSVSLTAHGYSAGDPILLRVTGMGKLDHRVVKVANPTTDAFELEGLDSTDYATFLTGTAQKVTFGAAANTVTDVNPSGGEAKSVDITTVHTDTDREMPGNFSALSYSFGNLWVPDDPALLELAAATSTKTERALQIVFATGTEVLLNSFPSASLAPGGSSGDKVTTPTSFKVRGPLTFYAS